MARILKGGKLRLFDLFAGIGGFRLAFELEGYKCVGFCEIDPKIRELYKAVYENLCANALLFKGEIQHTA